MSKAFGEALDFELSDLTREAHCAPEAHHLGGR
jgi:hypothetical protein